MNWPEPKKGIPEGRHTFTLNQEPELKATANGGRRIILYISDERGNRGTISLVPWEPGYEQLCRALGVEHGRDIRSEGKRFDAEALYEPDKNNPDKVYLRLRDISRVGGSSFADEMADLEGNGSDGDIPF